MKNKGITLVALVVTIIILLILAGISISALTQTGLFGKAKEAKEKYGKAEAMEKVQLEVLASYDNNGDLNLGKLTDNIIKNIDGATIEGSEFPITVTVDGEKFIVNESGKVSYDGKGDTTPEEPEEPEPPADDPIEKIKNTVLSTTDNTTVTDLYGNSITIPAGFKMKVDADTNNATTADKGIVIIDSDGNEFVWIPVPENGKIYTDIERTEASAKTVELNRYTFDSETGEPTARNDAAIDYYNVYTNGVPEEDSKYSYEEKQTPTNGNTPAKSITNFKQSVAINKGYYIGRYEARKNTSNEITEKGTDSVYDLVKQPDAATAARNMYDNTKPFTSDLMNSYAWDTATLFLQRCGTNDKYSIQESVNNKEATTGTNNQTTKDVQCNVYDMASNVYEWTTENGNGDNVGSCIYRGGRYKSIYTYTSSREDATPNSYIIGIGFRVLLYL